MVLRGLVSTVLLSVMMALAFAPAALAQDPGATPRPDTPPVFVDPLDPRAGEGASQVGAPLLALIVVTVAGIAAAGLTLVYVRVVRNR